MISTPSTLRSSFALAFWLLPQRRRDALFALHRFCRAMDEAVDGGTAAGRRASDPLVPWRAEVEALYGRGALETDEGRALAPYVGEYGLDFRDFDRLLEALAFDVEGRRFETEHDLARYCEGVASSPGYLSLAIFGCSEARVYAYRLGLALQLTNILRDAREDLTRGFLYFPLEDLRREGISPEALQAEARSDEPEGEAVRRLVTFERQRAREWFEIADRAYHGESARTRRLLAAARGMQGVYRLLLDRLEFESPLPRRRLRSNLSTALAAVAKAWGEARFLPG